MEDEPAIQKINAWDEKKEKQLRIWKNICYCYNHLHENEKIYLKKKTNLLLIISILLSSFVAVITSVATSLENNFWLIVISAIMSGLSAGVSFYTKSDKPEEKLLKHSDSSRGYRELVLKIEQQLITSPEDRQNANIFIKEITTQMLELETGTESMPIITPRDIRRMNSLNHDSSSEDTQNSSPDKPEIIHDNKKISPTHNTKNTLNSENLNNIKNSRPPTPINDTGLSHDENQTFQLFFNTYPSVNKEMVSFQLERLDSKV